MKEEFLRQYENVFTSDNKIMACGRNNCVQLINLANILEPGVGHGNIATGHMEVDKIVNLKLRLTEEN